MTTNATVVRVRPPGQDDAGDPLPGDPTRTTLEGCTVAPRTSADISGVGRQGVIVGLTLYGPFHTDLVHTDLVEISGLGGMDGTYELDGDAGVWRSPFTQREAGIEVALRRAAG